MQRILGIDPGSRVTGYRVIDGDGVAASRIASGRIQLSAEDDLPTRLGVIFNEISEVISSHNPIEMAIEQVFMAKNAATALKLGHARGAAICAAVTAGLSIFEYTPRMIKQAVVGSGKAEKAQVQHMVRLMLRVKAHITTDQADALAVAISHANAQSTMRHLAKARGYNR